TEELAEAFEGLGGKVLAGGGSEGKEGEEASGDAEEVEELGELATGGALVGEVIEDVGEGRGERVPDLPLQFPVLEELPWHQPYLEARTKARRTRRQAVTASPPS